MNPYQHLDLEPQSLLAQARVYKSFFRTALTSGDVNISDFAREIGSSLSDVAKKRLDYVAQRTDKAQQVVRILEKRFSYDGTSFADPRGLNVFLNPKSRATSFVNSGSYNIAVALQRKYTKNHLVGGLAHKNRLDPLGREIDEVCDNIQSGKETGIENLLATIFVPLAPIDQLKLAMDEKHVNEEISLRHSENPFDRIFYQLMRDQDHQAGFDNAMVLYHELRHIVDYIMGVDQSKEGIRFTETQTYLLGHSLEGIEIDRKEIMDEYWDQLRKVNGFLRFNRASLDLWQNPTLETLEEYSPEDIRKLKDEKIANIKRFEEKKEDLEKSIEKTKKYYNAVREGILGLKISPHELSYVISLTPPDLLSDVLQSMSVNS